MTVEQLRKVMETLPDTAEVYFVYAATDNRYWKSPESAVASSRVYRNNRLRSLDIGVPALWLYEVRHDQSTQSNSSQQ